MGTELEIADGLTRPLDIRLDIVVKSGYVAGQVKADVRTSVLSFFDLSLREMGVGFKTTEFIKALSSVPGLETFNAYFGSLASITRAATDLLVYGNKQYSLIKDIPSYSVNSDTDIVALQSQEVTRQLLPYEILILDSLTINAVSN